MAFSSSSSSRTWRYGVFVSFHGPDVRKTFLSHVRTQFSRNGITMFDDQGIERGQIIAPALTQAIRESKISIVLLSKNYASSSWCLDELVEILKCKEDIGQMVMTIFYDVDPSEVRKQTGDFGKNFKKTCSRKTKEDMERWSQALNHVGNIAGEHLLNWENESKMIEKIARDISNKLNTTISRDFEDLVGIEAHLQKLQSLLHLDDDDGAMIVGICGPAGIGKTTIARALHSRLSSCFERACFMENIRGSYNSGLDDYGLKLFLQEQLLSKILDLNGLRIYHLHAIRERLCGQKVFIILDDVDDLKQLEALANEINWFGPGSRIIVTTEDQELLEEHGINNTYHVDFPTNEEAHKIFFSYAFKQSLVPYGFEKLSERITELCSNLPLGLRVMGSSLRGKGKDDWERILHRLENTLDRRIEGVLRVGYENLDKGDQLLFLLIAIFFNYEDDGYLKEMLGNSDVILGLKNLEYKSLIQRTTEGKIVMHKLLRQVGREVNQRQDHGKRQILIDADEICDVLENDLGSRSVVGMSFDISALPNDVYISREAFKRIQNLRFLSIYKKRFDANVRVHVPEDMDFPPQLRLLQWEEFPGKCLPRTFKPEYLVDLNLQDNKLEKLWEGIQPLTNLKKMNLERSSNLKVLPDLSNATNLQSLDLSFCQSLVEIPSSIGNLHKLEVLEMVYCMKLQVVPTGLILESLQVVTVIGCWQLRKLPDISTNITWLSITDTMLEDFFGSMKLWSSLRTLWIYGSATPSPFQEIAKLYLKRRRGADIEKILDCIKDLCELKELFILGCPKLASLPKLPPKLRQLSVNNCESLERLPYPFENPFVKLSLINSLKLDEETRRLITHRLVVVWVPGRDIPADFDYKVIGNSITIPLNALFRLCVVISPTQQMSLDAELFGRQRRNGILIWQHRFGGISWLKTEHLYVSNVICSANMGDELLFEISSQEYKVIECGIQILSCQTDGSTNSKGGNESNGQGRYESRREQVCDRRNACEDSRSVKVSDSEASQDLTWYPKIKNVLLCLISACVVCFFLYNCRV